MDFGTAVKFLGTTLCVLVGLLTILSFLRFEPDGPRLVAMLKERLTARRRKQRELEEAVRGSQEKIAGLEGQVEVQRLLLLGNPCW
jgi:hypothetical protein